MHHGRGVVSSIFVLTLLLAVVSAAQDPGITEIEMSLDIPPGAAISNPGGPDTVLTDPSESGVPLEVMVTFLNGAPVTDLVGDPISVPVDFKIIEVPKGASGALLHPGGSDSVRVFSDALGFAEASFDMGDLPGIYRIEASSPYSGFNHVFTLLTGGFTTRITVVPLIPETTVDTVGGIPVDIYPYDRYDNPVLDAPLVVTLRQGPDGKWTYPVQNMGGGLYQAVVPSPIADSALIIATDTTSYAEGWAEVDYLKDIGDSLYFDTSDVQFMPVFEAEDQYYIVGTYLYDRFGNKYFEHEADYTSAVFGEPPIALVDSTWFENDYFMSRVRAVDVGSSALTVEEWNFGVTDSVPLEFYAVAFLDPEGTTMIGDTITVPLVICLADPADTLGLYDLEVSYNADALELIEVTDGDPLDGFDAPLVDAVNDSTVSLMQTYSGIGGGETTKMVKVASLTFYAHGPGGMRIDSPVVYSIQTRVGAQKPKAPVKPTKKKVKVKKVLNLKIFAEEGSGMTKEAIKKDIAHAQAVFDKNYTACCAITIKWDGKIDTFKTKDYDKDNDKKLHDYSDKKLTSEEKALIEKTKTRRKSDHVNVYYMKNNCKARGTKYTIGEAITKDDFGEESASVVSCKELRTDGSKEKKGSAMLIKGLAHEIAHFLGELSDKAGPGSDNLMEYNSRGKNDSGVKLTKEQCKKIMDKGTSHGYLKNN
jgi:hypothetical protein